MRDLIRSDLIRLRSKFTSSFTLQCSYIVKFGVMCIIRLCNIFYVLRVLCKLQALLYINQVKEAYISNKPPLVVEYAFALMEKNSGQGSFTVKKGTIFIEKYRHLPILHIINAWYHLFADCNFTNIVQLPQNIVRSKKALSIAWQMCF